MSVPVTASEASVVVLALLIVKGVLEHFLGSGKNCKKDADCMTVDMHDRECRLKLDPIQDGIEDLKESVRVMSHDIQDLPRRMNGGTKK